MLKRVKTLLAASSFLTILSSAPLVSATAQDTSAAATAASPTDGDLDTLLEARDWNRLGAALLPHDLASMRRVLDWLHVKLDNGAGFMVAYAYMRNLWVTGNALKDPRVTAAMIALYAYELILIDGAKCDDRTAPRNRAHQLLTKKLKRKVNP